MKGQGLYRINRLADLINLVLLRTSYSIGGFDAEKIAGDPNLSVGMDGEPFEAIGSGMLNIEGLSIYRDGIGSIGTPTSDE